MQNCRPRNLEPAVLLYISSNHLPITQQSIPVGFSQRKKNIYLLKAAFPLSKNAAKFAGFKS